jgi:hypothetical protein
MTFKASGVLTFATYADVPHLDIFRNFFDKRNSGVKKYFEYDIGIIPEYAQTDSDSILAQRKWLNLQGDEGWEVTAVECASRKLANGDIQFVGIAILKREYTGTAPPDLKP